MSEVGVFIISEFIMLERVFKVVFVGDLGVGKLSFIYWFCYDVWRFLFIVIIGNLICLSNSE